MMDLFIEGGPTFMAILTLIFIAVWALAIVNAVSILSGRERDPFATRQRLKYVKSVGLLGLVFGIFSQLIGLYQIFEAVQEIGRVSPAILMGGLKVSMISTLYGFLIFLVSYLLWFGLDVIFVKSTEAGSHS